MAKKYLFLFMLFAMAAPWTARGEWLTNYTFSTGTEGSWYTPSSWTQLISYGYGDLASPVRDIEFTFRYDGVDYTQFSVNTAGILRLGSDRISPSHYYVPFGSSDDNYSADAPKIVGLGRYANTGAAGYVRTGVVGSSGSYIRVIEFMLNTEHRLSGTTYVKFQIQLFQANNEVRIVYSSDYNNNPVNYQIGIGNADHNRFWYVDPTSHTATYSNTYSNITYSVFPGGGRYYSFIPNPWFTGDSRLYYITNFTTTGGIENINNSTTGTPLTLSDYYNTHTLYALAGSTIGFTISSSISDTHYGNAIWVDWNRNGIFESSERVYSTTEYANSPNSGSFTIPSETPYNEYSMRIITDHFTKDPSNPMQGNTGEFEDYKLAIGLPPANIPYTCDFENPDENDGWAIVNGSCTNKWYIGGPGAHDGNNGLYISSDNGNSNIYDNGSPSIVYAFRNINFPTTGEYILSFDWKQKGVTNWDCVGALLYSSSARPVATTSYENELFGLYSWPSGYSQVIIGAGIFESEGNWVTLQKSFTVSTAGTYELVIAWKNDYGEGQNPPAAVDNICVTTYRNQIYTVDDWNEFCDNVNNGHNYSGQTVTLMNDITTAVTTMCGSYTSNNDYKAFKGTFEGGGHTLTINVTDQQRFAAPFKFVEDATIQNLHTEGIITGDSSDGKLLAGLVGVSKGTTNIIGCSSSIDITSNDFQDGADIALSGLVAAILNGTLTIEGCAFEGSLNTTHSTNNNRCGGIVGYWYGGDHCYVRNTVFAPTALNVNTGDTNDPNGKSYTIARLDNNANVTIENCYYTQVLGIEQGKRGYDITGVSPVIVAMSGTATNYGASQITAYKNGSTQLPGLLYNGNIIAGNGDNVSLNLSGAVVFEADHGTLTGSNNPYTLVMEAFNTQITAGIVISVPYTYGFEEEAPWNYWNPVQGASRSGGNAHNGNFSLKFSGNLSNLVALPMFDAPTNTLQITFWTRPETAGNSDCGSFDVGYMTDKADASTFHVIETYNYNDFGTSFQNTYYMQKTVSLASAPANAYIAFRHNPAATNFYWFVDDVEVFLPNNIQTIELLQGWNWFSTYIEVEDPVTMLQMVEASLGENGMEIRNSQVTTEYDSEWGWLGDLDDVGMTNEQMYLIRVSAPCTVTVEGTPANPADHPITINQGWNWIGFPSGVAMSLEAAFADFAQEGDKIRNSESQNEYDPEWGWNGDFDTLEPSQGYMYYSTSSTPRTLVFPASTR
jgi:hypothetical protein